MLVPPVEGLDQTSAEAAIVAAGLTVGAVDEEFRVSLPTGQVRKQVPSSGYPVIPGSPVDLLVVAEPPAGVVIPDAWAGEWGLEITWRDAATGNVDAAVNDVDNVCPGDPFGIAAVEATGANDPEVDFVSCTATATDDRIEASCSGQITNGLCTFSVDATVELDRNGDQISGTGSWTAPDFCGTPLASFGQTIEIEGNRSGRDPTAKCASDPPSSFLQKFLTNPLLYLTLGRL